MRNWFEFLVVFHTKRDISRDFSAQRHDEVFLIVFIPTNATQPLTRLWFRAVNLLRPNPKISSCLGAFVWNAFFLEKHLV